MLGDPPDDADLPADLPHVTNDFARASRWPSRPAVGCRRTSSSRRRPRRSSGGSPTSRRSTRRSLAEPLDGPGGMRFKGSQMLRTRVFDMACHEQDVRRALGSLDGFAGPHLAIAVEQVVRAWAKLLPGQVDAPASWPSRWPGGTASCSTCATAGSIRGDEGRLLPMRRSTSMRRRCSRSARVAATRPGSTTSTSRGPGARRAAAGGRLRHPLIRARMPPSPPDPRADASVTP
jgi:hypothetical protein